MAISRRHGMLLLLACRPVDAFAPSRNSNNLQTQIITSSTTLHALPPLIIGPMIKKMRDEQQKANMPLANADEAKNEAPGLRVGEKAWKWPPVWPYDKNFFKRASELDAAKMAASPLSMMTGGGGMPSMDANGEAVVADGSVFDSLGYWEKMRDVKTDLDERVAEKIRL